MNSPQKRIFLFFLPLTLLILLLDPTGPYFEWVQFVRYGTVLALGLTVAAAPKPYPEQRIMAPAFFFMALGDFFLVFIHTFKSVPWDLSGLGILSFLAGYLFLIKAYQKNTARVTAELWVLVPYLSLSLWIGWTLFPYVRGVFRLLGAAFLAVLCLMAWRAATTLFQHRYSRKAAIMIAASGSLMYLCDAGIAFSLFHPFYSVTYIAWLKNMVWAAYLTGWSLAAMVIAEDDLYTGSTVRI